MKRMLGFVLGAAVVLATAPSQAQDAKTIARACASDIERLCAGVPPGEGRIKACMKAHITELSAPCFDTLLSAVASEKEPK
jgi:Cysteine rich repeat